VPKIIVHNLHHVSIDGQEAGSVVDVLTNYAGHKQPGAVRHQPDYRAEVFEALQIWDRDRAEKTVDVNRKTVEDHAKEIDEIIDRHRKEMSVAHDNHVKALSERDSKVASMQNRVTTLEQHVTDLGGEEMARRIQCKKLREQKASIEAKIAEMEGNPVER
jgi:uncharacterized protein YbcI